MTWRLIKQTIHLHGVILSEAQGNFMFTLTQPAIPIPCILCYVEMVCVGDFLVLKNRNNKKRRDNYCLGN